MHLLKLISFHHYQLTTCRQTDSLWLEITLLDIFVPFIDIENMNSNR